MKIYGLGSSSTLLLFACSLLSGTAHATTNSAVTNFSLTSNPTGAWSYFVAGLGLAGFLMLCTIRNRRHLKVTLMSAAALAGLGFAAPLRADFLDARMFNTANYTQTSTGEVLNNFSFEADAITQSSLNFNSATLTYPGSGSPVSLPAAGSEFFSKVFGPYMTLSSLHSALPFGSYTISFTNGSVTDGATINYSRDYFGGGMPELAAASFAALQHLNVSQAVTLDFNSFTPNSATNDTVGTEDSIYGPNGAAYSTFVSPTATSVTVPAGTLMSGVNYALVIDQGGRIGTVPNSEGVETEFGFDKQDTVDFTTTVAPEPATISIVGLALVGIAFMRFRK